ncbi:hypothetical protein Tco_1021351 [Tanacetum coccineum]
MEITVVTLIEEQMSPWKGNLPKLPIESNIVLLVPKSIVALEGLKHPWIFPSFLDVVAQDSNVDMDMGDKEVTKQDLVAKVVIEVLGRLLGDMVMMSFRCLRS